MECAGDGSCFDQVGINSYKRTDYKCEKECELQKCPNFARCGRLHPAWYLDCHGGFCVPCDQALVLTCYKQVQDDGGSSREGSVSSSTDDEADAEAELEGVVEKRLLAKLVPTQPLTHEEAVQQFHALQLKLAPHLVADLPEDVQKEALAEMWGVTLGDAVRHHVHEYNSWWCCCRNGKKGQ